MLAGFLPKIAAMLTQPVGQAVAAGLLTGVIGGSVGVATGAIPVGGPTGGNLTALFACPGSGSVVTSIAPGSDVLVIARSADGAWLELYVGEPGVASAWAPARALQLEAAPDTLPIGDCVAPATPGPTVEPQSAAPSSVPSSVPSEGPSPSPSPRPSATPKPTKTPAPTATPTPSPTPLTGPVLSELMLYAPAQEGDGVYRVYFRDPYVCPYAWDNVAMNVAATDTDGTASVRIYFDPPGAGVQSVDMMDEDGYGGLWDGGFNAQETWPEGSLHVWLQAVDQLGNLGPILDLDDLGYDLAVGVCVTESPTP